MKKDLLTLWDLEAEEILSIVDDAVTEKECPTADQPLAGKTLALVFEKSSTRTKVSFTVAAQQLGAGVVSLDQQSSQLGRGETHADTGRVLSQYVDGIVLRTFAQRNLEELAAAASVPVINGLSDAYHPCQVLADLATVQENFGELKDIRFAWVGDGNNMTHSWIVAAAKLGLELQIATPKGREPAADVVKRAGELTDKIHIGTDPVAAVKGAHVINADTWVSMGQEDEAEAVAVFEPYQVNAALLKHATDSAIVLHCLPAHRGEEITDEVMDGPQSRIWQQAQYRLHAQKIILKRFMGDRT